MKINEILNEEELQELDRREFLKRVGKTAVVGATTSVIPSITKSQENPALKKEIERTKEIFSKLNEFDRRIKRYEYDSKSKTLVLYGVWPQGPGYDGDNVAREWTIEFDPRIVQFVQLWSLDGKVKFGSAMNTKGKKRF